MNDIDIRIRQAMAALLNDQDTDIPWKLFNNAQVAHTVMTEYGEPLMLPSIAYIQSRLVTDDEDFDVFEISFAERDGTESNIHFSVAWNAPDVLWDAYVYWG